ncbi:MAG: gliding motility-associated C-terminal domain-containing protein [Chitinophagales bacterium]|nr:gliding motility-associated C-terminal domain-containing protein [Chitinophagales bacterium]
MILKSGIFSNLFRVIVLGAIIICTVNRSYGNHIIGGEIGYTYLGSNEYNITLILYRDCAASNALMFDDPAKIFIVNNFNGVVDTILRIPFPGSDTLMNLAANPCLVVPPNICKETATYSWNVTLPSNTNGYTIIYQYYARVLGLTNLPPGLVIGGSYEQNIPALSGSLTNSSPVFNNYPPTFLCVNEPLIFDHSATDPDGDSLAYNLCAPLQIPRDTVGFPLPSTPVPFIAPFSAQNPIGGDPQLAIDPQTGLLTGTPTIVGKFVVGVCVSEYRNKRLLSTHLRDFVFEIVPCIKSVVASTPDLVSECSNLTVNFDNSSAGAQYYHWDFGVPGFTNDTSNLYSPSYTFPDTGTYTITLYANPGSECGDTTVSEIRIYPVLNAAFIAPDACSPADILFTDQSTNTYGTIDTWQWNFGDSLTSSLQNPNHVYTNPGSYSAQLIVTNTAGCTDTFFKTIVVHSPPFVSAGNDTLICGLDSIELKGSGNGFFSWFPDYSISNSTIARPKISPDTNTTYILTIVDSFNCTNTDTVNINVINSVTATAGPDTTICYGAAVQLSGSGGADFTWTPQTGLNAYTISNPIASPLSTTTYLFRTFTGSCSSTDTVTIEVKPILPFELSPDDTICKGSTIELSACCGTSYNWSSPNGLQDPASSTQMITPDITTVFTVTIVDTSKCPVSRQGYITISVAVPPVLTTIPDTSVISGNSIQLYAFGGGTYEWLPAASLSDSHISSPVATPDVTTTYTVEVTSVEGCKDFGTVTVRVNEDVVIIFPNAFTPNGDGVNDFFKPFVSGDFETGVFQILDRWGQVIYESNDLTAGWNGKSKGIHQPIGTYIYFLAGKSLLSGLPVQRKGSVTLLR